MSNLNENNSEVNSTILSDNKVIDDVSINNKSEVSQIPTDYKLPDKFKTVDDLVKSYGELENKLGGFYGSPDEYKWELDGQEPDGVKLFKEVAKDNNLSQNAFNKLVSGYLDKEKAIVKSYNDNLTKIKKEIGDERILKAKNLINQLGMSENHLKAIDKFVRGKDEFDALEIMLNKINNHVNTAINNGQLPINVDEELNKIYSDPEYKYNRAKFHNKILELTKMKMENK